jgi:alanine dehydrogenase
VLIPGAKAPKLIRKADLSTMRPGSVIVDVAIDQGGCVETMHPTTHENPTFVVDGVIHYAVANMPGGVPRTSTLALTNATFPYALQLANKGWKAALRENAALRKGLNVVQGHCTHRGVAEAFGLEFAEPEQFLA